MPEYMREEPKVCQRILQGGVVCHEYKACAFSPSQEPQQHCNKANEYKAQNNRGIVGYCQFPFHFPAISIQSVGMSD